MNCKEFCEKYPYCVKTEMGNGLHTIDFYRNRDALKEAVRVSILVMDVFDNIARSFEVIHTQDIIEYIKLEEIGNIKSLCVSDKCPERISEIFELIQKGY